MDTAAEPAGGLLDTIAEFCRRNAMAESTFGRRAVNDGKLVARLRDGARITPETLERVSTFMGRHGVAAPTTPPELRQLIRVGGAAAPLVERATGAAAPSRNFRFFDNRQKYLLFVNTCSEKVVIARRVGMELAHIHPRPPAVRVFDAGMGDGTVLTRVMYVAQIDDERLAEAIGSRQYLDATREVLQAHGCLWFLDESYVVSRKRG